MKHMQLMTATAALALCWPGSARSANTQVIYQSQSRPSQSQTITRQTDVQVDGEPLHSSTYVEHSAVSEPSVTTYKIAENPQDKRSNYSKRLSDLLDQIENGRDHGWLNEQQYRELKGWQRSLEAKLGSIEDVDNMSGNGKISRSHADDLERDLNGLALTTNRDISQGQSHGH